MKISSYHNYFKIKINITHYSNVISMSGDRVGATDRDESENQDNNEGIN